MISAFKKSLYRYWSRRHWRSMCSQARFQDPAVSAAMEAVPQALQAYWMKRRHHFGFGRTTKNELAIRQSRRYGHVFILAYIYRGLRRLRRFL